MRPLYGEVWGGMGGCGEIRGHMGSHGEITICDEAQLPAHLARSRPTRPHAVPPHAVPCPALLTPFPARHAQPEAHARESEAGGEEIEVDEIDAEGAGDDHCGGGERGIGSSSAAAPDSGTGAASSTMTSPGAGKSADGAAPAPGPPPLRRLP